MKFIELTIHTTTEGSELVSDILWNYTNYGVAICDVNDIIELQKDKRTYWDYIDEDIVIENTDVLVKGYIAKDISEKTIKEIEKDLFLLKERTDKNTNLGSLETVKREVEGDDWIEIWKKHFRPIKLDNVVICPEWIVYEKQLNETVVKLDSNMAFGTGEHETTSMCIRLIQHYLTENDLVIDVGCGSGILGITAAMLGAKKVILTDIDYIAVKSAEHNSKLNGVEDKCTASLSNLLDDTSIKGDIIFANITAEILIMLSKDILKNLKDNGVIILSGIIASKIEAVKEAYKKLGYIADKEIKQGEWFALALKKVL
jgi:ribosomal protein L11 methyltransferase